MNFAQHSRMGRYGRWTEVVGTLDSAWNGIPYQITNGHLQSGYPQNLQIQTSSLNHLGRRRAHLTTTNAFQKLKKGEAPIDSPSVPIQKRQCCTDPTRSFLSRLTSTRPPVVFFVMVPSPPDAGAFPMLTA
jgi:hypothetical protein